jgi:hypothetical protein
VKPTTVVCVLFDGRGTLPDYSDGVYGPEWVDRLYRGFERNAGVPFRFLCLTDVEHQFTPGVESLPLLDAGEGCMSLLEMFRPDLGIDRGLFVGLDTVVVGDVTDLLTWRGGFGVVRSPQRPRILCDAVVAFDQRWAEILWRRWDSDRHRWRVVCRTGLGGPADGYPSEVVYLRHQASPSWVYLDDLWPGHLQSYKFHLQRDPLALGDARLVYFHGDPKPPNVEPELLEHWT